MQIFREYLLFVVHGMRCIPSFKSQEYFFLYFFNHARHIYIAILIFTSVHPYGVRRPASQRPTSEFHHIQSSRCPVRLLLSEAKPSYVYSILKPHGQSSKRQVWPILSKGKLSCIYSVLKLHGHTGCSIYFGPHILVPRANHVHFLIFFLIKYDKK